MSKNYEYWSRLQQRLEVADDTALADDDLIAALLGRPAPEPASKLLSRYGGLQQLAQASPAELRDASLTVGESRLLYAALALGRRYDRRLSDEPPHIQGPSSVYEHMRPVLIDKAQEELHVLLLSSRHRLLRDVVSTRGLVDRSQAHAREVFREAIRANCTRIILVHNHPGGDPTPSSQDLACTRLLESASKIVGIELLDHVIIGTVTPYRPRGWLSLREAGLMNGASTLQEASA